MLWLLLLAANEVGTHDVRVSPPVLDDDAAVTAQAPHLIDARYDLGAIARGDAADYRLTAIDDTALPVRRGRPLAVTAIDDERQRLIIGVKPGPGKNKLGVAYRLRLGR